MQMSEDFKLTYIHCW